MSHSTSGGTPFGDDDFTWALEPLVRGRPARRPRQSSLSWH